MVHSSVSLRVDVYEQTRGLELQYRRVLVVGFETWTAFSFVQALRMADTIPPGLLLLSNSFNFQRHN